LLRLLDPVERDALITNELGDRLLDASYELAVAEVGQVTGIEIRHAIAVPSGSSSMPLEGRIAGGTGGMWWDLNAQVFGATTEIAAHARIELRLTTTIRVVATAVTAVRSDNLGVLADVGAIDARIVADEGALPTDPAALADKRFITLKTILADRFEVPQDADIDAIIAEQGIKEFDDLLAWLMPPNHVRRLGLDLVIDGSLPARTAVVPVSVAVIVDDNPFDRMVELLGEVERGRRFLGPGADLPKPPAGLRHRTALPFLVLFPEGALDDAELPEGSVPQPADAAAHRRARLNAVSSRLHPLGVALGTVPA
jgi:hypothetical protein